MDLNLACAWAGMATVRQRVLLIPPLFEEANRMRRTLVLAMRALSADMGIVPSLLPDLPGQNDSLEPTVAVRACRCGVRPCARGRKR